MPVKKSNKHNVPLLFTPQSLPPPDRNMYKRRGNKELPPPAQLPAPMHKLPSPIRIDSSPSTYMNSKTTIFPTEKSLTNFKTQSFSPSTILPVTIVKHHTKKPRIKRCERGTRRNKKTMLCEKITNKKKSNTKRCKRGTRRNKKTRRCETKMLYTKNYY